ncbi:MAG: amidohydrolase [Victivallales bacterium]|nr:amidohydrolase [Victivallales bacterium]
MNIETVFNESDRSIYEKEFRDWLPEKIFDSHVHVFDENNFKPDYKLPGKSCYQKFNGTFTLEQCLEIVDVLLPDQEFSMNCFGTPDTEADLEAASKYTGKIADNKRIFGMALVSPKDKIETIKHRINDYGLIGYKPYRNFVDWMDYEAVTIFDMLSPEQMEFANEKGLAITLHIPKAARLADPSNQEQMVEICQRYPNAKIIFAHIGRAYFMNNVIGFLDKISKCDNAYIDTAMVNHPGVLEYAFNNFPRERIVFGSDVPIALLRGKSVEINNQYAYLMGEDYAIGSTIYDANKVVQFTTFFYEQLRGVKKAAQKVALSTKEIEDFFYNNINDLVTGIKI